MPEKSKFKKFLKIKKEFGMIILNAVVIVLDLMLLTMFFLFLRSSKSAAEKIGFGIMSVIMAANIALLWY